MQNLIIITKKFGPSYTGATYASFELLKRWKQSKLNIRVFYMMQDNDAAKLDCPSQCFASKKELKKLVDPLKDSSLFYSDVHLSGWMADLRLSYVHTYHGNWPDARFLDAYNLLKSFYFIPLYTRGVRKASAVVNVSDYFQERFSRPLNSDVRVIHNGINLRTSSQISSETSDSDESPMKAQVLMVGNLDKRKYQKAFSIIKACPELNFDIYGRPSDQKLSLQFQKLPNVDFKGFQSTIPYKKYKLLLSASRMENLSIAVCEAILEGLPVLGYSVGGLSEVIQKGNNGELYPLNRTEELIRKVKSVAEGEKISMDLSLIADFNWDQAAENYQALFKEKGLK